ncbi:MAG: porin, partial [Gemmatimonadetes bacterium]|nr:porin [Gemmatimonadota bacterium]NIY34044.1 porin [Gemmatimonadota bacterium]
IDENASGYGATVGGRINVGARNDVRFQFNVGKGLGRYLAMGSINGVMLDAGNQLHALPTVNGFIAYLHHWNDQWRSSVNF